MKTDGIYDPRCSITEKKTLQQLVSQLAAGSTAESIRKKSFIINDIPATFRIATDENMLATVLSGILQSVVNHAANSCIRIVAKMYGNVVLVHVSDSNSANSHFVANDLKQFQPLAEKLGGHLSIIGKNDNSTTVAFSFPNQLKAA